MGNDARKVMEKHIAPLWDVCYNDTEFGTLGRYVCEAMFDYARDTYERHVSTSPEPASAHDLATYMATYAMTSPGEMFGYTADYAEMLDELGESPYDYGNDNPDDDNRMRCEELVFGAAMHFHALMWKRLNDSK